MYGSQRTITNDLRENLCEDGKYFKSVMQQILARVFIMGVEELVLHLHPSGQEKMPNVACTISR